MAANTLKLNGIPFSCQPTWLLSHLVRLTVDISEQLNISMGSPGGAMEGVREEEMRGKERKTSEVETARGM